MPPGVCLSRSAAGSIHRSKTLKDVEETFTKRKRGARSGPHGFHGGDVGETLALGAVKVSQQTQAASATVLER